MRPQVNDPAEFLHATISRVAIGRDAELPAHVVVLAKPLGVVEGRVGEELAFAAQKTRQVASQLRNRAYARRDVGAVVEMEVAAEGGRSAKGEGGSEAGTSSFYILTSTLALEPRLAEQSLHFGGADLSEILAMSRSDARLAAR